VLGSPIGHSLSPVIWRSALDALGLDWSYDAIECDEAGLAALLSELRSDPAWICLSLTMPLKRAVLPLLDELCTPVGAVNTVLLDGGRAVGHNTDVDGLRSALRSTRVPLDDAWVGVLGAGGTARAAVAALAGTGVGQVEVAARTPADDLALLGEEVGVPVRVSGWDRAWELLHAADLVISTTPVGATDELAADWWRPAALVEVLYHPWPTPLAASAQRAGATVVGGLDVLVAQAAAAIHLVTGRLPDVAAMRTAADTALAARPHTK
jgi:shikimate dehydrogenase